MSWLVGELFAKGRAYVFAAAVWRDGGPVGALDGADLAVKTFIQRDLLRPGGAAAPPGPQAHDARSRIKAFGNPSRVKRSAPSIAAGVRLPFLEPATSGPEHASPEAP